MYNLPYQSTFFEAEVFSVIVEKASCLTKYKNVMMAHS